MSVQAMLAAARDVLFDVVGGPAGDVARELLEATQGNLEVLPVRPSTSEARRHLSGIEAGGFGRSMLDLDWHYGYADRPDLARDVAFANIVGPIGPLVSSSVRLGLTMIGPEILYPDHHHPAVELYIVLSGTADWSAGRADFVSHGPGAAILHPSDVAHAMRTGSETLLALFGWTGAIEVSPVYRQERPSPRPS